MDVEQEERLVIAYEAIAKALGGIHDEAKRAGLRFWPQQREQREAIVTRVESDRDRELRMQGGRIRNINDVVDPTVIEVEDEEIGERTREWLRTHPKEKAKESHASSENSVRRETERGGVETAEDQG